jgi:peptidyl-prolyl cis-trans isomerase SurA
MKKLLLSLLAICSFVLPALAQQQDTVVEEIVARVNNSIITRADLRRNREQTAQDAKDMNVPQKIVEEKEANSLRDLIDQQLLIQKAADLGISADADLVKRLDDLRKEMKASSMDDLQKIAEGQGVSWEDFKLNTKNGILTQKVIGSEVGSHIQVTREEAQKFYEEHKAEISQPERVRLSEILIANNPNAPKSVPGKDNALVEPSAEQVAAAEARANDIYQQLKAGAKFDELARKESNASTAEQGGDLGYFKRKDLAKELEDRSFALKVGEFTAPIRTRQGFIILRVNDHIEAGTPPFERVRDQIQEQLYSQKVQPALRDYLTKLREEAYIDIKPGYTDSGASPNQTKLVFTSDTGPKTKQVRGKLGVGKKKTVVVVGKAGHGTPTGSTSELGLAKAEVDAKEKAENDRKAAAAAAAAKAAADAAEKEKLSHMSKSEQKKYLAHKKKEEKKEAKLESKDTRKQKKLAAKAAKRQAAEAKAIAKGKKPAEAKKPEDTTAQQADPSVPPKKKKSISWF